MKYPVQISYAMPAVEWYIPGNISRVTWFFILQNKPALKRAGVATESQVRVGYSRHTMRRHFITIISHATKNTCPIPTSVMLLLRRKHMKSA